MSRGPNKKLESTRRALKNVHDICRNLHGNSYLTDDELQTIHEFYNKVIDIKARLYREHKMQPF